MANEPVGEHAWKKETAESSGCALIILAFFIGLSFMIKSCAEASAVRSKTEAPVSLEK